MKVEIRVPIVLTTVLWGAVALLGFAGEARAITPTPTPAGICSGVPAWTDCCGCTYTKDQKVTYGSPASRFHVVQTFTNACGAGWNPPAAASLFALDGACGTATATPTAVTPTPTTATATVTARPTVCATAKPVPHVGAVTGLAVTAVGSQQVSLQWNAVTPDPNWPNLMYEVRRSTTQGSGYVTIASFVSTTTYTDTSVVNGTTYYYVVGAVTRYWTGTSCGLVDLVAGGPASNEVSAKPTGPTPTVTPTRTPTSTATSTATSTPIFCPTETPPPTPAVTDLAAAVGDKTVTLTWSWRANRYSVFRATALNGPYATLATGVVAGSYVDSTVANGTTYYYTVQGFVDWSYGVAPCPVHSGTLATSWSNMMAAVPQVPVAPSPGVPVASASVSKTNVALGSTVTVAGSTNMGIPQWNVTVVDLATGVEQDQSNPIFTPARPAAQANPAFTLTAARTGAVRFNMTVSGEIQDPACGNCFVFKAAGASSASVSAGAPQAQGYWGSLTCSGALQASATVSWSPIAGASGYNVKYGKSPAGPWTSYGSTASGGTSVSISDPTKSGYYYVTALSGTTEGPPSNVAQGLFFSICP
jgi:hypothetical protein